MPSGYFCYYLTHFSSVFHQSPYKSGIRRQASLPTMALWHLRLSARVPESQKLKNGRLASLASNPFLSHCLYFGTLGKNWLRMSDLMNVLSL